MALTLLDKLDRAGRVRRHVDAIHPALTLLGKELIQLEGSVAVHISHIKPGEVEAVMGQIGALGGRHRISALSSGQAIGLGGY